MAAQYRFVVDVNVGRLAKWLRVMGYDAIFPREGDDNDLARIALRENRVLESASRAAPADMTSVARSAPPSTRVPRPADQGKRESLSPRKAIPSKAPAMTRVVKGTDS